MRGIKTQKAIKEDREIKVFYNEEIPDQPLPAITNLEELKYQGGKLKDLNLDEGRKLTNIEEGAMNLANHTSDELPEGVSNKYDDQDASNRAKAGLTAAGFVQKVIRGANITGTPTVGVNMTNQYIGYYNGTTWPVYIANNGLFMFQGNSGNYITWDGSTLNIRGRLNADDITAGTIDANVINVVNINANNITAGTITGRTIKSSNELTRIEIDCSNPSGSINLFEFGVPRMKIAGYGILFYDPAGNFSSQIFGYTNRTLRIVDTDNLQLVNHFGDASLVWGKPALYPDPSNITDLGSSTYRWKNLYLSGIAYIPYLGQNLNANTYEINNLSYLKFNSSYGRIYWGTARAVDMRNAGDPLPSGGEGWHRWDMRVDMIPCNDYWGQIGTDQRRWWRMRAVEMVSGDFVFENKFRITEEGDNALAIYNQRNEKILIIDEEGNINKVNN